MQNQKDTSKLFQIEIALDRANATYKPFDTVSGSVNLVGVKARIENFGFILKAEGRLVLQNQSRSKNLESLSTLVNSKVLCRYEQTISQEKIISPDKSSFPFKFKLDPLPGESLLETYIGVYVAVEYEIRVELKTVFSQTVKHLLQFYVQIPESGRTLTNGGKEPRPISFAIRPTAGQTAAGAKLPNLKINGILDSDICKINEDLTGIFTVEERSSPIKSIDLQLVRVEKVEGKNGKFLEATEIQLIQIAEGDITPKMKIPIYMIFPRYFCCPNFNYKEFQVTFELNFIIILCDGFKITQNFPLFVVR